ncbi:hypothetical protein ACS0TY_033763 [Phlomoides rotata]
MSCSLMLFLDWHLRSKPYESTITFQCSASASADSSPKSQLLQQMQAASASKIWSCSDMLVHLAREKYENNLRIPKSLEKVSVLFADWYNICETSDHFFSRIMELSVSNCVSSEDMKPQSHQGQQISFLLLLRIKDRVNSPFCPRCRRKREHPLIPGKDLCSLDPVFDGANFQLCMARVGLSWEFHAKITHRKWTEGVALFSKIAGRLVPVHGALFQLDPVHFLYKGTHTRALLTWELFYFAMSQNCYDHYWLRLDFQKICMILYLFILLLVALLIFGSWLGFWFVRKLLLTDDGSIDSGASHFVSWSIRIVASVLILQSSIDPLLAAEALVGGAFVSSLLRRCSHPKVVRRVYK